MPFRRWCRPVLLILAIAGLADESRLWAAESNQGFSTVIRPAFTGEEIRSQHQLWGLEVSIKPMRMVFVQVPNPRTGAKSSELVWYLVYKVVNRPVNRPADAADSIPVNVEDPPIPPVFVPQATLITEDRNKRSVIVDSVVPEALQAIITRERLEVKTSVQLTGPLPKETPANSPRENAEYGVFMFRGVNPKTTAFSVYLSGFTNAYKIGKDESGKQLVLRRTIVIPYHRFADEFDQFEKEIRQGGEAKWIYVPDEGPVAGR